MGKIKTKFDGLPEPTEPLKIEFISTGSDSVDAMLGGGIPRTRITQVYGPEDSCKTVFAYRIAAMAQRKYPDEVVVWIDVERTFNADFAELNGVDMSKLRYHAATKAEDVANLLVRYAWAESGVSLIVVDSIGHTNPASRMDAEAFVKDYNQAMGKNPKINTDMAKNVTEGIARPGGAAVLVVNQIRFKLGGYGDPETTPGGQNLKHSLSLNLRVTKVESIDVPTKGYGVKIRVRVKRSKLGNSNVATTDNNHLKVYFAKDGIEDADIYNLRDEAIRRGIISKKGAWYTSTEIPELKSNGDAKLFTLLKGNAELQDALRKAIAEAPEAFVFGGQDVPELEDELDADQ